MEQSNARAWGRAAGERAGVAAGAVVRCALRAVAVNVVAVVAAPFLAACSDPTVGPQAVRGPGALQASVTAADARGGDVIPDEYIVTFRDSVRDPASTAAQIVNASGGSLRFTYRTALKGFAARLPAAAARALAANPRVLSVESDRLVLATDSQNPVPSWGLDRIDQRLRPLDGAYTYANAGAGVNVYILDSGIRITHAEFGGRAVGAYTAVNDGWGTNDCRGHGTHVAAIVAGARFGVAKAARLHSIRVLDCNGTGTSSGFIAGIDWVTRNRVLPAVANMSLRGTRSATINSAVQASINAGVVYAVAAGNDGSDACNYSPASAPEALTVGAVANTDGMPGYSNFGPCVDVFAPGSSIRSASSVDDTSSVTMRGTSRATPHVAGVAALYLAANPQAPPSQVASALLSSATRNAITGVPVGTPNLYAYAGALVESSSPSAGADIVVAPPTAPDEPPSAAFAATCSKGRCTFDATGSTDDRGIATYAWNFGDGSPQTAGSDGVRVTHAYSSTGTFMVTLMITDTGAQAASRTSSVRVRRT
jgi:subtilisin family serine protease